MKGEVLFGFIEAEKLNFLPMKTHMRTFSSTPVPRVHCCSSLKWRSGVNINSGLSNISIIVRVRGVLSIHCTIFMTDR